MSTPSPEVRTLLRRVVNTANTLRALGIKPAQVQSAAGPAGFPLRLAALLADDVECACGGEHIPSDHTEASAAELVQA